MFVGERVEVEAAAGFVEAGSAYDDQLLRLAEALGVDGGLAAGHADGGELGDLVGEGHEVGHGAEGLVGEGCVEAGEDDALAEVYELEGEWNDIHVEELDLVEAYDVNLVDFVFGEEVFAEAVAGGSDDGGVVGLLGVAGDGGAVVAEVDVGLVAGDALLCDAGALEAADELFGLAGEHGTGDDFHATGVAACCLGVAGGHPDILSGWGGGFLGSNCWRDLVAVFPRPRSGTLRQAQGRLGHPADWLCTFPLMTIGLS